MFELVEYSLYLFFKRRYIYIIFFAEGRDPITTPFLIVETHSQIQIPRSNKTLCLRKQRSKERLRGGDHAFHHRFSVKVRGPIDEVEGSKEDRKHYTRHLVDLAHTVVGLLRVHHLGFCGPELHRCRVRDGGDGHVLGEVGGVVDARRANVVGLFRQHHGVSFLQWDKSN